MAKNGDHDYSKGKIYLWIIGPHQYVGSTIQTLPERFSVHKHDAKTGKSEKYKVFRKIGQDELSSKLILIKKYPCKSIDELHKEEQRWIDKLKPDLNQNRAFGKYPKKKFVKVVVNCPCGSITSKDHLARHKRSKKHRTYAKENGLTVPEKKKFPESNCPCGGTIGVRRRAHFTTDRHKKWLLCQPVEKQV